ncbi:MAG: hypothetical protein H6828_07195 [Planctomycetes bacterium]|nr:hypothetical protein [Planctomycetota bacterium]
MVPPARLLALVLSLVGLAASAAAQGPGANRDAMWPAPTAEDWQKPCLITWQRTWEDALEVSRRTGKPILVAVNMDGEPASEHWAGIRYREPATGKLFEPYVNVIASVYRHNPRDYDEHGARILCPRFGSVTCGEHIRIEPLLYEQYFEGKRVAPRHIGVELDRSEQYDVYYAFDIDSVKNAVRSFIVERPDTRKPDTGGDRDVYELVASPDVVDRVRVEQTYVQASYDVRRRILETVRVTGAIDHVDLLRRAIFGDDADLSRMAFELLCAADTESAVDLIADVLRYPMSAEERAPLLEALDRLAETWPRARDIATVHRGLGVTSHAVDPAAWAPREDAPAGSASYAEHVELSARLEAAAQDAEREPEDPAAQVAIAESFLALAVRPEAARRTAQVLFEDAYRSAQRASELGATGWPVESVLALASHYLGRRGEAWERVERAAALVPEGAADWNSMAVLALFADMRQQQIRRAARRREHWPQEWLSDLHAAHEVLARHPFGTDQQVLAHYDLLRDLGAGAQASEVLDRGLARFPDSWGLHDRLRARCLEESQLGGLRGLEATYAAMLAQPDASPNLPWFAGYASFVAAEYHRRAGELEAADAAYRRALAHYDSAVERNPESRASADHYAALVLAARARLALERGDLDEALALVQASFARGPRAAGSLDGLNLTPVMTAQALVAELRRAERAEDADALREAIAALPPEARELPEFERNSRGQGPSEDARRFRRGGPNGGPGGGR